MEYLFKRQHLLRTLVINERHLIALLNPLPHGKKQREVLGGNLLYFVSIYQDSSSSA